MKKMVSLILAIVVLAVCTFSVTAAGNDFVPSIEIKPGPGIVENPAESGNGGIIIMPDGTEVIVPVSEIIITPIAQAGEADDHIRQALEDAFADITGAGSIADIIGGLQGILDQIADGVVAGDLVVSDLFHVDLTGDYAKYVEEGGTLTITFSASSDVAIALSKIGGAWSAVYGDALVLNADGSVTMSINSIGVYAFLKNAAQVDVDPENPGISSPTTGYNYTMYAVIAVVLLMVSAVLFVAYKKQNA